MKSLGAGEIAQIYSGLGPICRRASFIKVMKIRTLLILLVLSAAAGCGQPGNMVGPTPPAPSGNAPHPTRVEGRVLDGDREGAVAGAVVTGLEVWGPDGKLAELPALSTTADDRGAFGFTANLPQGWFNLILRGTRDGYEPSQMAVRNPSVATAVVLWLQPRITIRAGESIQTRVLPDPQGWRGCGFEYWSCRRFFVEPPSGESMDVEVAPADDQLVTLMVGPHASHDPLTLFPNQRRVTVSGGEVWIYGEWEGGVRVTLTAHRR
jgi:predicted small lipoprotein YifL